MFKRDSRKPNGVGSRCKGCNKSSEPIPHKAFHRLKAKQKLYDIEIETTKEEVAQIFELFEGRCAYCNIEESEETGTFHLEHIIPMSREGSRHHVSNLAISCASCNAKKNKRPLIEFYLMHKPFTGAMLDFIFIYVARFSGRTPEEVAKEFYAEVAEVDDDEQT
ncbi:HNH endonuclease [Paenisporosarcina sp. NPDC076898]|uniref:HNH endonuclease n=1 Tax=Paenisporosarcina sp. NPDC076898 TaxID=3390603 RepID=UPI003D0318E6